MKKLIFVNQKGGSGKSILSYNMAHCLADSGQRVLFVDADEQANSSKSLAAHLAPPSAGDLFGDTPIKRLAASQNIALLRGSAALREVERSDKSDVEMVMTVRARLADIAHEFDYCVIDTPGSNSRVANALLVASDFALIPCKIDPYSISVAGVMLKRIKFIQGKWNQGLINLGILANEYDARQPAQVAGLKQLMSGYRDFMLPAFVVDRSAYREACGAGVPVWRLEADSDEDGGKGKVKTAARVAGHEIKAVFKMIQDKMEAKS